jgi:hypothetical protein
MEKDTSRDALIKTKNRVLLYILLFIIGILYSVSFVKFGDIVYTQKGLDVPENAETIS